MHRQQGIIAQPTRRAMYQSQTTKLSYAETELLDVQPLDPIQNNDGTFPFLLGYDRF